MKKKENSRRTKKKQTIIEGASRLILQKGVDNASLAEIAREIGISKGTLYYYYATKDELVFDIAENHIEKISDDLFALIDQDGGPNSLETALTALVEAILKAETRSRMHLYLIREALTGNQVLKDRFVMTYRRWFEWMQEGLEKTLRRKNEFDILAPILVAVLDGFVIQSMLKVQELRVKNIVHCLMKLSG